MVDEALLATKIAAVNDAVARIRDVLPADRDLFVSDRSAREIVSLNLLVALQGCIALATHWLADAGLDVPQSYAAVFQKLADRNVIPRDRADRLAAAAGFRNLVVHQYGVLDWNRVYIIASERLDDLLAFCNDVARRRSSEQ